MTDTKFPWGPYVALAAFIVVALIVAAVTGQIPKGRFAP